MLTRRSFLQALGIGVAAAAVPAVIVPERRIWQVGVRAPVRGVGYVHGPLDELEDAVRLHEAWNLRGLRVYQSDGQDLTVTDPSKFLSSVTRDLTFNPPGPWLFDEEATREAERRITVTPWYAAWIAGITAEART